MRTRASRRERRSRTDGQTPVAADQLARVFQENVDAVYGYLLARCGSRQLAEEVASDTFAEAARAYADGRASEVQRAWLLHVARLRLIDHWRRAERHRARIERVGSQRTCDDGDPAALLEDVHVVAALDSLSERQRAVLVLRYLDGYSVSEVADALDLTYQATESLLARARRAMLAAYEEGTS